jgi:hypothetical protein
MKKPAEGTTTRPAINYLWLRQIIGARTTRA